MSVDTTNAPHNQDDEVNKVYTVNEPDVICECGHHCCGDCKCAEIPDPIHFYEVCPCTKCKDTTEPCNQDHYKSIRWIHPSEGHVKNHTRKNRRVV